LKDNNEIFLQLRQHDTEENVRFEVVKAIVATARQDDNIVSESEDLLNYVKERTLDKKVLYFIT
jgi:sister-chromatid-cohesion protein PDS5